MELLEKIVVAIWQVNTEMAAFLLFRLLGADNLLDSADIAGDILTAHRFDLLKVLPGFLEPLVLQQLERQLQSRIFHVIRFIGRRVGQQHARFDKDQRGHHLDKFTGDFQVENLHQVDIFQIFPGDVGDGDIVDIDLVLPDKVQEQIEGTFKNRQFDLIHSGLSKPFLYTLPETLQAGRFTHPGHHLGGPGARPFTAVT